MEHEIWKQVPGFNDRYLVSNHGRVKSLFRNKERILKFSSTGKSDYDLIGLSQDSKQKMFLVHRLVMMVFTNPIEGLNEVNHIDGDKHNNRLDNLEWTDRKGNVQHGFDNGLYKVSDRLLNQRGSLNHYAVFTESQISEIRWLYEIGYTQELLAEIFNSKQPHISLIVNKKTWKHVI